MASITSGPPTERLKNDSHVRFMLAGPGAARDALIADAHKRGLDNVVFLPPQPKSRMPAVWSLCNVALIYLRDDPVFAEVIPSKIFEAMAMGLPLLIAVARHHSRAHQPTAMMAVREAAAAGCGHQAARYAENKTGTAPKPST